MRMFVIGAVTLACLFTSGVAVADVGCNQFSGTFTQALTFSGFFGEFAQGQGTDCVSYNITDRVISSEFSIVVNEGGGSVLSDVLSLTNGGPNGTLDVCFQSYNDGNTNASCSLAANVTTYNFQGDPALEVLRSGNIYDVPTGITWVAYMVSQDVNGTSDFVAISAVPEPASMMLLGTGVLGVAGLLRRKINL